MNQLEKKRINEIRARLDAATPGPWNIHGPSKYGVYLKYFVGVPSGYKRGDREGVVRICEVFNFFDNRNGMQLVNTELIANAPDDIKWLLDQLDPPHICKKGKCEYWNETCDLCRAKGCHSCPCR